MVKEASGVANKAKFEEAMARFRLEFIESSGDRLDEIDAHINRLHAMDGGFTERFLELQRSVHTLKGSAGSFGFPTATVIAHRLEDYIETADTIGPNELDDIQIFVDVIRRIFESGDNPPNAEAAVILRGLPSATAVAAGFSNQTIKDISVVLVMPLSVQRKIVAGELASCGFRVTMAETGVAAVAAVMACHPDMVVASFELADMTGGELAHVFAAIEATRIHRFMLMTSFDLVDPRLASLPDGTAVVRKGNHFAEDLMETLVGWGVFG